MLAGVLLDIAALEEDSERRGQWEALARREAVYVAAARLPDRHGGWSYFPTLAELPPDLDSLGAAMTLFGRAAWEHLPACMEAAALALSGRRADGGIRTWLISPLDPPRARTVTQRGVQRFWGEDVSVDACARFGLGLLACDAEAGGPWTQEACRTGEYVADQQGADGLWQATWYWGPVYGTALCLELLEALGTQPAACAAGLAALRGLQRRDGGWGSWESVPLDTAVAVRALARWGGGEDAASLQRVAALLLDYQRLDGAWNRSPWIRMEPGRASGKESPALAHGSATLSTACALAALLALRRASDAGDRAAEYY